MSIHFFFTLCEHDSVPSSPQGVSQLSKIRVLIQNICSQRCSFFRGVVLQRKDDKLQVEFFKKPPCTVAPEPLDGRYITTA